MSTNSGTEEEDDAVKATSFVAVVRLSFLTAGFALAALYVENTYGRIRFENLYYPYFVVSMLALIGLTVYFEEIRGLVGRSAELDFGESVRATVDEWRQSIGLVLIGAVYIFLIDWIGFFASSAMAIVALMVVGGTRDAKQIVAVTVLVLVLVYLLFVQLMGLQPPQGRFGV